MTYLALVGFIALSELAGIVGTVFTVGAIPTWYAALTKPPLNPPGWVFGPVWTVLYALMGIAAWMVWRNIKTNKHAKKALVLFGVQLALNAIWTPVFFGAQRLGLALVVIALMWIAILATTLAFAKVERKAAILMAPYLAWVTFASYLNFALWILNK